METEKICKPAKSMAGSLKLYFKNQSLKAILRELQGKRRKSDRF